MSGKSLRIACTLLALTVISFLPSRASATLLSTLISTNGTITVGSLTFSDFAYLFTGDMPPDSAVNVVPYTDGFGNAGLKFQGAFLDFIGGAGSDALIDFKVTVDDEDLDITGASLSGNPVVLGGNGVMCVTETFEPGDTNLGLSIYSIVPPGSLKSSDAGLFAVPHKSIMVHKDILAYSAAVNGGVPTLSLLTQAFSTTGNPIPEPSTFVLAGTGLVGLALIRRRVRRRR